MVIVKVGDFAGNEVFDLEATRFNFIFTENNAGFGEFGGISNFIAEFFIGKNDINCGISGAKFFGESEGKRSLGERNRDNCVIKWSVFLTFY